MRWVSTRVLPEPAPATTSSGPPAVHDGVELVRVEPHRGDASAMLSRLSVTPRSPRTCLPPPGNGIGELLHRTAVTPVESMSDSRSQ